MLAMAQQANQMQAANMLMRQRTQELEKENAIRAIGAKYDIESQEYVKALTAVDPDTALKALTQQRQAQAEVRRAKLAEIQTDKEMMDIAAKHGDNFQKALRMVDAYPEQERPAAYGRLIAALPDKLKSVYPPTYSPEAVRLGMSTTAEILAAAKPKEPQYLMGPAGPLAIDKNTGTFSVVPEVGAGAPAAPAPAAPGAAATAGPAIGDAQARRTAQIEGTGKNPMSSAQGKHQFIDSTFVTTARKTFPELANKSPAEILALRGAKLPDGTQIEDALEQRFRADNIASLASAGIQPTPGNTYLAHFLGAGGARSVLGADPSTPVSQLLDPRAIAANKSILANKTAGEVAAWAANKFAGQPGFEASATAANTRMGGAPTAFAPVSNALASPTAPTVNNALMANMFANQMAAPTNLFAAPQQTPLSLTPSIAGPAATAPAATLAGQRAQVAREKLAEKGAEQRQTTEIEQESAKAARKDSASRLLTVVGGDAGGAIERLIQASTSGKLAADLADRVESITGRATKGMTNIDALAQISESLTYDVAQGKYGAGFSNADREALYRLSGDIANREKGAERRVAAFKQFRNYLNAIAEGKEMAIVPPAGSAATAASKEIKYTEGQTATGPNGAKLVFRNGQWTPQ
jgi:hypothetical protein